MAESSKFRLTYATMFDPPEELHTGYEKAVETMRAAAGQDHPMWIGGQDVFTSKKSEDSSPIDTSLILGTFQDGGPAEAELAMQAAKQAAKDWGRRPWQERVALVRKAAEIIDQRVYQIAAVISLEGGKTRMEALADAAETSDLMRYACDQMEANNGFVVEMGQDPLKGYQARNTSKLRPYGVWVVISPFNFPAALTGGPMGAALIAGNTVVYKPAEVTPWTSRLLAECFRDAGFPDGVVNYVTGRGSVVGQALIDNPLTDGVTFTGSVDVGMGIYRSFAAGRYPRPTILEMGGKNPAVVSRNADLERAVQGLYRSAFGNQGQKCSAASRIYVEEPVYEELLAKLAEVTRGLNIGDPTRKEVFLGPVVNQSAYESFKGYTEELSQAGEFVTGGKVLTEGELGKGYFCEPTIAANVPLEHRLWKHEMFLPITMVHKIKNLEEGMALANDVDFGLTAGFYGAPDEAQWFFENIEAGVTYANRPQGATTGAWPGFQPFGGWKGSGSTGKNAGGHYYVQEYMREQVNTVIE
ncbi:MAG: aldehyde dehydrogenase family protein [Anaerolineales bacterium]|nr:aldehyde dehydrogenase family protein [Anaerolineales bacterium]MCW5855193.1 aldehyde dehydrogenase family protein [Anaerolineales bacterium]